jgi:hypothetical protein
LERRNNGRGNVGPSLGEAYSRCPSELSGMDGRGTASARRLYRRPVRRARSARARKSPESPGRSRACRSKRPQEKCYRATSLPHLKRYRRPINVRGSGQRHASLSNHVSPALGGRGLPTSLWGDRRVQCMAPSGIVQELTSPSVLSTRSTRSLVNLCQARVPEIRVGVAAETSRELMRGMFFRARVRPGHSSA